MNELLEPRADEAPETSTVSPMVVTAPSSISNLADLPTTTESITADQIAKTINVLTPEDALRYLPNILIRQRGTPVRAGVGVGVGTDHTLFALVSGKVAFKKKGPEQRTYVSVLPN